MVLSADVAVLRQEEEVDLEEAARLEDLLVVVELGSEATEGTTEGDQVPSIIAALPNLADLTSAQ